MSRWSMLMLSEIVVTTMRARGMRNAESVAGLPGSPLLGFSVWPRGEVWLDTREVPEGADGAIDYLEWFMHEHVLQSPVAPRMRIQHMT